MKSLLTTSLFVISLILSAPVLKADSHVLSVGSFVGKSDHETSGKVSIEKAEDGSYVVVLADSFRLDGAPDPKVALGKNGYQKEALLGKLEKNKGSQTYKIPAHLDPADFNEVWIWCEKFSVPLGLAKLS